MNNYFDPYEQTDDQPSQGYYHYTRQNLPTQHEPIPVQAEPVYTAPEIVPPPPKKEKKPVGLKAILAVALCCSLLGGLFGAGGVILAQNRMTAKVPEEVVPAVPEETKDPATILVEGQREAAKLQTVPVNTGKLMSAAEVYAANVSSTVGITTTAVSTNYWGYKTTSAASGSGFILSADGYILTNYHVIEDSSSITVSLFNGESYEAALIGYDESNDIAVLKIEAEGLVPVILGSSDNVNVGDDVVAIGNPLGELTFSLTSGAISAKDRQVTLSGNMTMNLLQTDCAINSGNSGGALFNMYGEVIGVTNAKYSGNSGSSASIDNIGFAIPINSIRDIIESIIEKGYIAKPYIGVQISDVSEQTQAYGIPAGIAIQGIVEGGPAEQAGLQTGDILTAVNGKAMTSDELIDLIADCQAGQAIRCSVYRQGETLELTLTVGENIQSAFAEAEEDADMEEAFPWPGEFPFGFGDMG